MNREEKTKRLVVVSILSAIIIILQMFAAAIKLGPFTITLSLIPIVLGAIMYGAKAGAILGLVFGIVVDYNLIVGVDVGGHLIFEQNPISVVLVCLLKGILAGLVAGIVSQLFIKKGKTKAGIFVASMICPIVNTLVLSIGMLTIFKDVVSGWMIGAGSKNIFVYLFTVILGWNFVLEIAINIILVPVLIRAIGIINRKIHR